MASPASAPPVSASTPSAATPAKEFRCIWGSCTKSFSRAEHLHRHALNHDEIKGTNTCQRCNAVFKRKDLLDRHMARHREKDAEAGGEGLGKLQTRKRLWRDSTGAVVAKRRPELEKSRTSSTSNSREITRQPERDSVEFKSPSNQNIAPISPPRSLQDQTSSGSEPVTSSEDAQMIASSEDLWPVPIEDPTWPRPADINVDPFDFLCNASWGSQPQESNNADLLYNDLFAPDTASSFNMPFTTMSYYNWLFGNESWPVSGFDTTNAARGNFTPLGNNSLSDSPSTSSRGFSFSDASYKHDSSRNSDRHSHRGTASEFSTRSYSQDMLDPETSAANQILAMSKAAGSSFVASLGYHDIEVAETPRNLVASPTYIPTPRSSQDTNGLQRRSRQSRKLPVIGEIARERVLSLISRSHPKALDGSEISIDHPLLALSVLQDYSDLYFKRFNISYPLLHQATFDPDRTDPLLLTSVLLLGATYSDKESHLFAICIHDVMRAQIFGSQAFNTRPTLWMLQTILLVECFGKSRAGQLQHDMSHLFHGLLINLIRRSDCQSARCQSFEEGQEIDIETKWKAEVDAEQRRRLALLCFMWDTQHAVLFSQSLCMNAAELKLSLPWSEALWEADSAEEWRSINQTEKPQPQYLSVLKTYINPGSGSRPRSLNALSRVLMLHGLMSVAWDLNRRDQTSLGIASIGKGESWQSRIAGSYDAWKSDFDAYSDDVLRSRNDNDHDKQEFQRFCVVNLAIYHAAHIILQVEINDLQIYAGASHIIGRQVTKPDVERSRHRIQGWANEKNGSISAAKASSHAARVLKDGLRKLKDWDAGDVFHYPWCLYLATLTVWAFQTCSKAGQSSDDGMCSDNEDDSDWDARAEMSALVSAMTRSNLEDLCKVAAKYRTGDLPRVMAKHLSTIRWAVVQEGMIVLKGLTRRERKRI